MQQHFPKNQLPCGYSIFPISAYSDNYIWCLQHGENLVVVDPGDAAPVLAYCQKQGLSITSILITHHHWDHTDGLPALVEAFPNVKVFGPARGSIQHLTHKLNDGEQIQLPELDCTFSVMAVPGHTLDHIAYYGELGLFCGDTLFSVGCGRLFEGSPKQMYDSLSRLSNLPGETVVYCTHEYTLANIHFARQVEPHNKALLDYSTWAQACRGKNLPTLPTTISQQKEINPFLRSHIASVANAAQQRAGTKLATPENVFACIRGWKDQA